MVAFLSPPGMRARRARKKRCWTIWPFSLIQQSLSYDCYSALGLSSEPSSLGVPCILRHNLFFSLKLWAPLTQVNITMYNQTRLGRTHFNLKEVSFCWYKCDIKLLPFFLAGLKIINTFVSSSNFEVFYSAILYMPTQRKSYYIQQSLLSAKHA